MIEDISSEDFLDIVWADHRDGWVDLPAKVGDYWVPWHHEWEGECDASITRRIDACLRDGESLYFSVGVFSDRGRNFDDFERTFWLWADLDGVHPATAAESGILPTIAWESSPGRYQSLWRLERQVSGVTFDKLNQALSYFLGADHGGWDRTQVLRIPGTRNYKYGGAPEVKLLWHDEGLVYSARKLWSLVRASLPVGFSGAGDGVPHKPPKAMPTMARKLLRVPPDSVVSGERSSKLWQIECLLAEAGWGEDAIYDVVEPSAWNKWSGLGTGERRLRAEIRKAISHVARKAAIEAGRRGRDDGRRGDRRRDSVSDARAEGDSELGGVDRGRDTGVSADASTSRSDQRDADGDAEWEDDGGDDDDPLVLPFVRYGSFMAMAMEEPRWLIKDIWTAGSHGIFGGEPKTSKTTLSLALGLSVASGKPFLGKYSVATPGPVLLVQEENAQWQVQDRLRKLANYYGLLSAKDVTVKRASKGSLGKTVVELEFPSDVPLRLLNNHGLDLTSEEHREALWAECEVIRPRLLVLDPMYLLLAGLNFDKAQDVAPYLKWILAMRNEFDMAIILIHHFRKASMSGGPHVRSGQRLMGSATLHGFVDCALYAEQMTADAPGGKRAGTYYTRLEREFRSMEPQGALEIGLRLGRPGALDMQCEIRTWDLQRAIEDLVMETPGITVNQIAETLDIDKRTALGRCRDSEVVAVTTGTRGRGKSHTVHPKEARDSDSDDD